MEKTAFKERLYFVESYQVKYRTYHIEILSTTNQMNILVGNLQYQPPNIRKKLAAKKYREKKCNVPHYTGYFTKINTVGMMEHATKCFTT